MDEAQTLATPETGIADVTFRVSDMTCGHCAGVIRGALEKRLPGAAVAIDIARNRVTVAGDAMQAEAAIRQAGYSPEPIAG